jgi:hypothetical protein
MLTSPSTASILVEGERIDRWSALMYSDRWERMRSRSWLKCNRFTLDVKSALCHASSSNAPSGKDSAQLT